MFYVTTYDTSYKHESIAIPSPTKWCEPGVLQTCNASDCEPDGRFTFFLDSRASRGARGKANEIHQTPRPEFWIKG